MADQYESDFDPKEVARIISEALQDQSILPLSFIETTLFDRLNSLLTKYMSQADVVWVVSELRNEFLKGFTSLTTPQLHNIIRNCTKCPEVQRPPVLPSWNTGDPDLMIVVENPAAVEKYLPNLTSALKEAGFSSQRCMLTYLTRCSLRPLTPEVVKRCLPYLHTEIAVVNPKLILTLGLSCYAAMSGDETSKLNEVKGNIFWFGPYAVLPETSLGASAYAQEKSQSTNSNLANSLSIAYSFLYGGHS